MAQGGEGQDAQERRCCEAYHCLFSPAEVPNCQSSYMRGGVFPSSHDGECASWLRAGNLGMGHIAVCLPSPPSCPLRGPWQGLSVPRVLGFSLCQASPPGQGWEWGEGLAPGGRVLLHPLVQAKSLGLIQR